MSLVNFLFLKRSWELDGPYLKQKLSYFKKNIKSLTLVLFPEGTVLCQEALNRSHKYTSEKSNIKAPFHNVLLPKSTGLFNMIENLGDSFTGIIDVTIKYHHYDEEGNDTCITSINADGSRLFIYSFYTIFDLFLKGRWPSTVYIDIQWIPSNEIPTKSVELFTDWLYSLFARKDKIMPLLDFSSLDSSRTTTQGPFMTNHKYLYILVLFLTVYITISAIFKILLFWFR